ncbi:hypothetical protein ACFFX0_21065 [Citricoccus parietis]|uniref:Uncharacterized protein n=1 Tax=Citricoccus parietis TaxID=592307 RepID=A0ABV5G3P3_9MICC
MPAQAGVSWRTRWRRMRSTKASTVVRSDSAAKPSCSVSTRSSGMSRVFRALRSSG